MSRNSKRLLYKYHILERESRELDTLAREFNREPIRPLDNAYDGDSSDEFGVFDPETYVSFDDKIRLSEQLKKCRNEKRLTRIVHILNQYQQDSVEDIGSLKL